MAQTPTQKIEHTARLGILLARLAGSDAGSAFIARHTAALIQGADSLHKLAEAECNYGLTARQEVRQSNLVLALTGIAAS